MNKIILSIIIIVLVVLFGTWPLSILAKICNWIATAIEWLANALNVFGWNGLI